MAAQLSDRVKAIEFWRCGYQAPCKVKYCQAKATILARSVDSAGRPINQYELCAVHAEQGGGAGKG
jgi:hypothetical protein